MSTVNAIDTIIPNKQESLLAEKSSRILAAYMQSTKVPAIQLLKKGKAQEKITLPSSVLKLLLGVLSQLAEGNAVAFVPIHTELTTQEAANLLNVSRPFLVQLLDEGKIPYRKVGTKRRIYAKDLLAYKVHAHEERLKVLSKLSKQAQDLDMGY